MNAPPQVLSILELLDALEKESKRAWSDALLLTFNFEASFFEGRVLGRLRALGARVAVLADARVWDPDPISLGNAGRAYLLSPVLAAGAFHPKLVLLVGEDASLALIGSGNVSVGGWVLNAELWNQFEARDGRAPTVLFQLALWLRQLSQTGLRMSDPARQRLGDVATSLQRVLDDCQPTDDGTQLVSNLVEPISEALPSAPAADLLIGAPFVDGHAVRKVVDRIAPATITWLVQEQLTSADLGKVRAELAGGPPLEIRAERLSDASHFRYRHGKFIEWRTPGGWVSLTGSPNLTTQALYRSAEHGGNVELGVLREADRSIWPDPGVVAKTVHPLEPTEDIALAVHRPPSRRESSVGPTIVSAIRDGDALLVDLADSARRGCQIQGCDSPLHGGWQTLGSIPTGTHTGRLPFPGKPVRIVRATYGALTEPGASTPVTDAEAIQQFPMRSGHESGAWRAKEDVMKEGPWNFLRALGRQVELINGEIRRTRAGRPTQAPHGTNRTPGIAQDSDDTRTAWLWEEWDTVCAQRHGSGFRRFARGLPRISPGWPDVPPLEIFDDGGDVTPDPVAAPNPPREDAAEPEPKARWELQAKERNQCIEQLRRYAKLAEPIPSPDFYLAVGQVTLYLYTQEAWFDDDAEPIDLLRHFINQALAGPSSLVPADSIKTFGELASVLVSRRVDFSAGTQATLAANALFELVSHSPGVAQAELLEEMLRFDEGQYLLTESGTPLTAMTVLDALDRRATRGDFDAAVRIAESAGLEASIESPFTLTVAGKVTDAVRLACQLLDGLSGPVALHLIGSHRRYTVLWREPDLFLITHQEHPRWEHLQSPRGLVGIAVAEQPGSLRVSHGPLLRPISEAIALARDLGIALDGSS
jgi:hypothetical protein